MLFEYQHWLIKILKTRGMNKLNEIRGDCTHQSLESVSANEVLYSEIEASGPPVASLGFPAPQVIHSDLVEVICFDTNKSMWVEAKGIVHLKQVGDQSDIAYMLTSIVLKQTICGEVIKGIILRRTNRDPPSAEEESPDNNDSIKHVSNLWETTDKYVAIKVDRRKTMEKIHNKHTLHSNPENPWKEISAMQLLGSSHPDVMSLLGAFTDKICLYEVMQYCSKGNLNSYLRKHPSGLSEYKAREFFLEVLSGVKYIHSRGICHHDLSIDNILLYEAGRCIIIDFGMCLRVPYTYPDDPEGATDDFTDVSIGTKRRLIHSQNHCGKLHYMAPEIYQKREGFDGYAADVWSLGVVLFVLLTGRQPYGRPDEKDSGYSDLIDPTFYWNTKETPAILSWGHEMSLEAVDLIRGMLNPDPRDRATLGWISSHKWVTYNPPID